MPNILIQLIGAVAFIFLIGSYFRKEKAQILTFQIIALIVFTIHYQFLGGITGAICNFISAIMMLIIYFYDKSKRNKKALLIALLIPVLVAISILSWENIYSIFPIIASVIMLIAFLLNNENHIRIIGLISNILWTIYAIIHVSYVSIVFETISVIGTSIALIKNYRKMEKNK